MTVGLIGSLTWLKISLDDAKSRNPDAAVVTFLVYFLVGAIVDICIMVRIKRDLGTGWAVAAFFLWMVVLPVALYKMFRLPEGRSPIGTLSAMAIAAILLVTAGTKVLADQYGGENRIYRVEAGSYVAYTPTPRVTRTPTRTATPTPRDTPVRILPTLEAAKARTATPENAGAGSSAKATPTPASEPETGNSSYDSVVLVTLLDDSVAMKDSPGTNRCETENAGVDADGTMVVQYCDWGVVVYYVMNSDANAAQLVRSLRDGSEFKLDDYPEYPTSLSIEDDTASFAVAYGNVVVVGVTSEEQLTWFGFTITDGTLEQRSGILAEYGVRRIERLAGAPRLGPSAGGTW